MRIEGSEIPKREMRFATERAATLELRKLRGYPAAHLEEKHSSGGLKYIVISAGYGKYLREDGTIE